MTNNKRIFWAIEQVAIKDNKSGTSGTVAPVNSRVYATGPYASGVDEVYGRWEVPRGTQSCGMSTTFNLQEVFQLGQVEVYEQSERQPDIELTMSKCIDGSKPIFFMVTDPFKGNDIIARTVDYRTMVTMQIYPDSKFRSTGRPVSIVTASGMYVSSASYTFPVDGFVTEDITLVGNDKLWGAVQAISGITQGDSGANTIGEPLVIWPDDQLGNNPNAPGGLPSGVFGHDGLTSALEEGGAFESATPPDKFGVIVVGSGVVRREEVDIRRSILPSMIPGVIRPNISGIDGAYVNGGFGAQGPGTALGQQVLIGNANTDYVTEHIQTITVSADLGRADIFELGSKRPFAKVIDFPIEVTASVEVITAQGDMVDATSAIDCGSDNTQANETIVIRTCEGFQVDLGDSNRLTDVQVAGGEAGGDNMTVTYNFQSFNVFNVSHDFYQPNHRILVFETGNSRFNVGAPPFKRSQLGIF